MELFGLFILIGIAGLTFWLIGKLLHVGWICITLPIKLLLFLVIGGLFVLLLPLGLLTGLVVFILPLGLILLLLPFLLIGMIVRISQK
jgi:hypothetical protein